MDNNMKNKILEQHLGKIGEEAGAVGGSIGGGPFGRSGGASGGKSGATRAAKKLKTFDFKDKIEYNYPITDAISNSYNIVANLPNLIEIIEVDANTDIPYLSAVVGSGFGQMNPTIICLEYVSGNAASTTISISASAKEGLIKQKSAQKAVLCIKEMLNE